MEKEMRKATIEDAILEAIRTGNTIWNRRHGIDKDSLVLKFCKETNFERAYKNLLKKELIKEEWAAMLKYKDLVIQDWNMISDIEGMEKPIKFGWFVSEISKDTKIEKNT
jgi:hypothetical protein